MICIVNQCIYFSLLLHSLSVSNDVSSNKSFFIKLYTQNTKWTSYFAHVHQTLRNSNEKQVGRISVVIGSQLSKDSGESGVVGPGADQAQGEDCIKSNARVVVVTVLVQDVQQSWFRIREVGESKAQRDSCSGRWWSVSTYLQIRSVSRKLKMRRVCVCNKCTCPNIREFSLPSLRPTIATPRDAIGCVRAISLKIRIIIISLNIHFWVVWNSVDQV